MAQPQTHIDRTRKAITELCDAFEYVISCTSEYAMLGGDPGVAPYWTDAAGQPIARDITHAQYTAAIQVVLALQGQVNNPGASGAPAPATLLYPVKG